MTRSTLGAVLLMLAAVDGPPRAVPESLRFNPVERTEKGLDALERADLEAAEESFATARRLAPDAPLTRFNEGTAKLLAGREEAAQTLADAARLATPELAPAAFYNLGNAHLERGRLPEAIAAYEDALRADPTMRAAKHNLELALRLMEEKQQQQQEQQQPGDEQSPAQDSPGDEANNEEDDRQPRPPESPEEKPEQGDEQKRPSSERSGEPEPEDQPERDDPLPGFEPQVDMTPEQAASILEAVENLEREQRRQEAEERARRRGATGKDW